MIYGLQRRITFISSYRLGEAVCSCRGEVVLCERKCTHISFITSSEIWNKMKWLEMPPHGENIKSPSLEHHYPTLPKRFSTNFTHWSGKAVTTLHFEVILFSSCQSLKVITILSLIVTPGAKTYFEGQP